MHGQAKLSEIESKPRHDAFISYSRKNEAFASCLEKALERYKPPAGLKAPRRHLEIFRDRQDFTGNEYHGSLESHLRDSAKLIVICSPEACQSEYVNDEIRQFAHLKGPAGIIPVLVSGIPNNEARQGQEAQRAFPPALCEVMAMPLAADFRGFAAEKSKISGSAHRDAWYTTLANIYDVPRAEMEQREKRRRARTRWITSAVVAVILCLIAVAATVAYTSRLQARAKARDAQQLRYIGNIGLAWQAYNTTDIPGMVDLLKAELPSALTSADDLRGFEWYYLWRLSQGPNATMTAHDQSAEAVAFSPDGKLFATSGDDGKVKLWSVDSGKVLSDLGGQDGAVASIAFSPDGKILATAGEKIPVRLWDVSKRNVVTDIKELGSSVSGVAFSPDGRALATVAWEAPNKMVRVWDMTSRRVIVTVAGDPTASASNLFVAFSPDGAMLALSSGFGVKLCRFPSGQTIAEFDGAGVYVSAVAFAPDGKTLVAASDDGKLLFFDLTSRRKAGTLDAHDDYISGVAFSPDGKLLVTASADKTIKLWDARSHAALSTLRGHTGGIQAMAISPDGRTVASTGGDKTVRLWEISTRPEYEELGTLDVMITGIAASPADDKLALASANSIVIWDPSARKELAKFNSPTESINDVAFSADGRTIAFAGSDKGVGFWDTVSRKSDRLLGHTAAVYAVAFSPDGRVLASTGADRTIRLWDVTARRGLPASFVGHAKSVTTIAFSPDGKTLATGSNDRTVRLWDVESRRELASSSAIAGTFQLSSGADEEQQPLITSVAFSPNGQLLATAAADGTATLWRVAGRALQRSETLAGHTGIVNHVVFSPDGRTIATAGSDTTLRLWNASLFRELITLKEAKGKRDVPHYLMGSEDHVSAVAFSRDGKYLATGLVDGTVRFRRAATNVQVAARN